MPGDPQSLIEWGKGLGLTGVCALLGYLLKWTAQQLLKEKDTRIQKLEEDLEKVKAQRDAAREQVFAEKDKYHRLVENLTPLVKETGGWLEYFGRDQGGGGGRRGGRLPSPPQRDRPLAAEDEGGGGTARRGG